MAAATCLHHHNCGANDINVLMTTHSPNRSEFFALFDECIGLLLGQAIGLGALALDVLLDDIGDIDVGTLGLARGKLLFVQLVNVVQSLLDVSFGDAISVHDT